MLYNLMIENLNLKDVNPLICGYHDCPKSHAYGPSTRSYYLLHYIHSGKGKLMNSRNEYSLSEDQIFVIRPHEVTTYQADGKDPWSYSWIGFGAGDTIGALLSADIYPANGCGSLFQQMLDSPQESGRELFLTSKIYEILSSLMTEKNALTDENINRYVRIAKNYIESNLHEDIRVAGIAENLGIDRSYFSHLFSEQMELSPRQYLLKLRMRRAADLLENRNYSVSEIAHQSGYPDVTAFSRMFKRYHGLSPKQFRHAHKTHARKNN